MSAEADGRDTAERLVVAGLAEAAAFRGMLKDFDKPAGLRCPYQRHKKGCTVYSRRPFGCRAWACRWLTSDDTGELQRPDRSHYVVDETPDFIVTHSGDKVPIVQVWIDPDYPDAHRDPALRAYLLRRWQLDGHVALVRYDATRAMLLWHDGERWHERFDNMNVSGEHSAAEKEAAGLGLSRETALARVKAVTAP
jgi:hypothetical protein